MDEKIKINYYHFFLFHLILGSYKDKLCLCDWTSNYKRETIDRKIKTFFNTEYEDGNSPIIEKACTQLKQYMLGHRVQFDIPIILPGTSFQNKVWNELTKIEYGKVISYAELAKRLNMPNATRAVAAALSTNPLSIFLPCHRVIGSNGKLTGYTGGIDTKEILLDLERTYI